MAVKRARYVRSHLTDAERLLWWRLRLMKDIGLHFRRQAPFGRYVVDFVCHSAKTIVELDGGQHAEPHRQAHDQERTLFLQSEGYRVLRIWNNEVFENLDGVVEGIARFATTPPPEASQERGFDLPTRGR